jgi:hypothetical protein
MTGAASAATFTIGSTTEPGGASVNACGGVGVYLQTGPSTELLAAGGQVTQWQTNTDGAKAGDPIALVAASPQSGGIWKIDAIDWEKVPSPAGGVVTFTPANPMMVSDGDALGVAGGTTASSSTTVCGWTSTGGFSFTGAILGSLAPTVGEAYEPLLQASIQANFSATVVANEDSSVTTTAQPATVSAGSDAVLSSTVRDNGPASNPLTFVDAVPAGLTIDAVDTAAGSCTTLGQQVTCTLSGISSGQSGAVNVIVTPTAAGSYTNTVTLSQPTGAADPSTANNTASAILTANAVVVPRCNVPNLAKLPVSTVKSLLGSLGCKAGSVTKAYSSSVPKGDVIKTTPGKGAYAAATSVSITESKGRRPKKKHHALRH